MRYPDYENETWITKIPMPFEPYKDGESTSQSRAKQAAIALLKNTKGVVVLEGKGKQAVAGVYVFAKWKIYRYELHAFYCVEYDYDHPTERKGLFGKIVDYPTTPGCQAYLKPKKFSDGRNWSWRYRPDTEEGQNEELMFG